MSPKKLLLAVLASVFFLPVSCTVAMFAVARTLPAATTRDLARGDAPHLPIEVPLFAGDAAGEPRFVALADVPAMLAATPALTPRPPGDGTSGEGESRERWRIIGRDGDAQVVELQRIRENYAHTVRYRATDAGVAPLTSRLWAMHHAFIGFAAGVATAFAVWLAARRWRKRAGG
jgi:hypothetical protein